MNASKVVLIQPPIRDFYLTKKRTIPYGLAAIAACIRKAGFDVEILDALATDKAKVLDWPESFSPLLPHYGVKDISLFSLFHEFRHFGYSFEHIATQVRLKQPFLVGISSLFTAYSDEALQTAQTVKKFYPECRIVMGGHHPTRFPEKTLECPDVDFVLRGEGETGMPALLAALQNKRTLESVPGICFRQEEGALYISEPAWSRSLDEFPLPAYDLINMDFYQRSNRASVTIVSSRGCPMKCSYCSVSSATDHPPFRQRSVTGVVREIEDLARHLDIGFIDFEDENLSLNRSWFLDLFSNIRCLFDGKAVELRAMNGLYPPSISPEIVSMMRQAGFKTLNLSLGSTSEHQLKQFRRNDVRSALETALQLAGQEGLDCVTYIIAAAPGQTAQSSLADLLYLASQRTLVGLSIFYPAPGSLDYRTCEETDLLPESFALMRSSALPLEDTTSRLEAVTLLRLSRILNFMKHLIDQKEKLPRAKAFPAETTLGITGRETASEHLLQWFLHDGVIRGITPQGQVFDHPTDQILVNHFLDALNRIDIKGVRTDQNS